MGKVSNNSGVGNRSNTTKGGASKVDGAKGGAGGNTGGKQGGGWPSTTPNPSGTGRINNPHSGGKK